jgi:hypothetical protein
VRAPLGSPDNGPHPTDRAKLSMKEHVLIDGRGVPVSVAVTEANCNDRGAVFKQTEAPVAGKLRRVALIENRKAHAVKAYQPVKSH